MIKVVDKIGSLPEANWNQPSKPIRVILHDTAGPTLASAEQTLKERGLGYHYMIDRNGTINQYYDDIEAVNHAFGNNKLTIGVSLVGGDGLKLEDVQITSTIELLKQLKANNPTIKTFSSHKEVDPRHGKIDPEFHPFEGTMDRIADETGLTRYP